MGPFVDSPPWNRPSRANRCQEFAWSEYRQSKYDAVADCSDAISQLIVMMDDTSIIAELNNHVERDDLDLNDYVDLRNYLSRLVNLIPDLQCKYKLQDAGLSK